MNTVTLVETAKVYPFVFGTDVQTGVPSTTTVQASLANIKPGIYASFQAIVTGTGAVTATVAIQVSEDGVNWCTTALGTISLTGTTTASDGFATASAWKYVRANVTAITGTGASVSVLMGA